MAAGEAGCEDIEIRKVRHRDGPMTSAGQQATEGRRLWRVRLSRSGVLVRVEPDMGIWRQPGRSDKRRRGSCASLDKCKERGRGRSLSEVGGLSGVNYFVRFRDNYLGRLSALFIELFFLGFPPVAIPIDLNDGGVMEDPVNGSNRH